jgi:hypothetical protein
LPRRNLAIAVISLITIGVVLGELYITPNNLFDNPFYWTGLAIFILVGAFPLAATRSAKTFRVTVIAIMLTMFTAAAISDRYPVIFAFAFGFPGLFIGLGSRALSSLLHR